ILNPPANVPIFLASTAGSSPDVRKALSWLIALNVFLILVVSMFVGSYILHFFGLSLPIVQVGGGLLIMSFDWTFLLSADPPAHGGPRLDVDRHRARRQHVPDGALPGCPNRGDDRRRGARRPLHLSL